MVAFARRSFSGTAPDSTLSSSMDGVTLTATCANLTGWPDGSAGNFVVIFDPGTVNEEKCLASARSGNVLTLVARAFENSAVAHSSPTCVVRHGDSAHDFDEANNAVSQTVGAIAAKGDLLVGSAANTLTKLPIGSTGQVPTVSGGTLVYATPVSAPTYVGASTGGGSIAVGASPTTIFTTPSLATGVWLFSVSMAVETASGADTYTLNSANGTATSTGQLVGFTKTTGAAASAMMACSVIVTVTVAGTILIQVSCGSGSGLVNGGNSSGYWAIKVA